MPRIRSKPQDEHCIDTQILVKAALALQVVTVVLA